MHKKSSQRQYRQNLTNLKTFMSKTHNNDNSNSKRKKKKDHKRERKNKSYIKYNWLMNIEVYTF